MKRKTVITRVAPSKVNTKSRHFLLEVFGVPVDVPLNGARGLIYRIQTPKTDHVITEKRFEMLSKLSDLEKYQEIVDKLNHWYDSEQRKRLLEYSRKSYSEWSEERKEQHREYSRKRYAEKRRDSQ